MHAEQNRLGNQNLCRDLHAPRRDGALEQPISALTSHFAALIRRLTY
jgi:hypothetical protein